MSSFPYSEGFENTLGAWTQSADDDIDWRTNSGSTPSSGTGPTGDHTSGFAKYLYIEASGSCYGETAKLVTPCIDLGTTIAYPFMTFWYHMYGGNTMDTLSVDVFDGTTWHLSKFKVGGNQGNTWRRGTVDLTPYTGKTIKLRFNGTTGNFWNTDIAIDDINISDHTSIKEDELANSIAIFPNPNQGEFNLNINNAQLNSVDVSIYDMFGRIVYQKNLTNKNNRISLSDISAGVYTVKVSFNGQSTTKRIVVN